MSGFSGPDSYTNRAPFLQQIRPESRSARARTPDARVTSSQSSRRDRTRTLAGHRRGFAAAGVRQRYGRAMGPVHATALEALKDGTEVMVAAGGDGTVNAVASVSRAPTWRLGSAAGPSITLRRICVFQSISRMRRNGGGGADDARRCR